MHARVSRNCGVLDPGVVAERGSHDDSWPFLIISDATDCHVCMCVSTVQYSIYFWVEWHCSSSLLGCSKAPELGQTPEKRSHRRVPYACAAASRVLLDAVRVAWAVP